MQKQELLENLKTEHDKLEDVVKKIQFMGVENEIIDKKWVLKDVISHLSMYEREAVKILKKKTIENNIFYTRTDDDRNEENFTATHGTNLQEIIESANSVYNELYNETDKLTQKELDSKFPGMSQTVGNFIAYQSYGHYPDHIPKLQKRFSV